MERLIIETKNDNGPEVESILQKMMADNYRQPFILDFNRPNDKGPCFPSFLVFHSLFVEN